jgi:hypothetical protein
MAGSIFDTDVYSTPMSQASSGYDDAVNKFLSRQTSAPQVDFSKATLAEQMPQKTVGGEMLSAGDAASTASSFGPPPVQAIGLGLKAIGMIEKARMAKYQMELQRIKDREAAANRMAQIGQSLRV